MSTIFNEFSAAYDVMFPWEKREQGEWDFYSAMFTAHGVTSVLDCACGTGRHTVMFARMGKKSAGSDLSPAMVEKARAYAMAVGVTADFRVSSFTELSGAFAPQEQFDAVICVGNSLTLAPSDADVAVAVKEMYRRLTPAGICIVHLFNWDKLARERLRIMPASYGMLQGRDVTFLRVFAHEDDRVTLNIVVMERTSGGVETSVLTAIQRPVGPEALCGFMSDAGFQEINTFADQRLTPFDPQASDNLWIVAKKGD